MLSLTHKTSLVFAMPKKIFISFAIEDKFARDNLVFQAKQIHTPFEFIDMSVKEPWRSSWKTNCRTRIKGCAGVIAFISDNTLDAEGARWEIKCAYEEGVPVLPLYIHDHGAKRLPSELAGKKIHHWTWDNVIKFLNKL
jgi:Thoeris protein ThsB, TIR-like domain